MQISNDTRLIISDKVCPADVRIHDKVCPAGVGIHDKLCLSDGKYRQIVTGETEIYYEI